MWRDEVSSANVQKAQKREGAKSPNKIHAAGLLFFASFASLRLRAKNFFRNQKFASL
jgi:hypothetical protein